MRELYTARPWPAVRREFEAAGISYTVRQTRSPRDFFKVDEQRLYVVRTRESAGGLAVMIAPAPGRSASLAAYDAACR
ncbi:hypothetical protein [Selenomonas sp. F0473]|uniref:hypothetical protein n=1 Tax=Selenomonas sp. F0473 TaxID=999423 RepID=UPI00029E200D|nr:hypothetical protein [Selenomonas sp. F0473]EKU71348.1 hypothetical protein HMPREF9161_00033 [Selenomonas sp. F0473]